ncbi:putative lytic murein transglycosylase [Klebsiella phage N1M2]|uniref:Putative lytic murein transglycosylase n=1 Tax=Klebsiella phage N1M2 TaxID=2664939 RepID=A0A6B7ZEZ5_9CAUD|nr:transglycosylase [Klebsiella phage N1M2]QGH71985.1 putative lytic murein transglycosylase [Klebsiella phage N1M2]
MNSKTQTNLMSIFLLLMSLVWISTVSTAYASVGANPNEYTTKIVMKRFDGLKEHLYEASKVSGMDMADLVAISSIESTLRTNTRSKFSSASGVMQYTRSTWKQDRKLYAKQLGLSESANVLNPRANLLIGATSLNNLKQFLIEKSHLTDKTVRVGDLYMSHLVGANGALAVINSNSNKPINKILRVTKGNYSMYYKPNGQIRTAREFRSYMDYLVKRERSFYEKEVRRFQIAKVTAPIIRPIEENLWGKQLAIAIANTTKYVGYNDLNS